MCQCLVSFFSGWIYLKLCCLLLAAIVSGMKSLSDDFIHGVNARLWAEASAEFGSSFAVPTDRAWSIGEYIRGLFVLQVFVERKGGSLANGVAELRHLSISESTIESLVADGILGGVVVPVSGDKPLPRKARLRVFEDWAKGHRGEQFETDVFMEIAGFSRSAMLDYLKISRLFVKVKRGVYQVVDR